MTNNVLIVLSCGTDNPNRGTRAFHLATIAQKEGKNVTMFLLDEGVYLAKKGAMKNMKGRYRRYRRRSSCSPTGL